MRFDLHAHHLPKLFTETIAGLPGGSPIAYPEWSFDTVEEHLRLWSLDGVCLSPSPPGAWLGEAAASQAFARELNEWLATAIRDDPARRAGLAALPMPDLEGSLEEARYALDELGLDGVMLLTNQGDVALTDPRFAELFDLLEERAAYVFVHPNSPLTPNLTSLPDWMVEYPTDTARALAGLLYDGTYERCPSIRFQFAHLGGTAPFIAQRIASLAEPNRDPAAAAAAPAGALSYLRRLYYDTGLSNNVPAIDCALAVGGEGRVVFGSDWPYCEAAAPGSDPTPALAALDGGTREAIDAGNAFQLIPRFASLTAGGSSRETPAS
ncbi:MAG TPA: amidohydrolase family protein [Solirubrobacteraceae bacterium]|nr:amidohydrolase family protein [Solirubrobacteraceae bacterium]